MLFFSLLLILLFSLSTVTSANNTTQTTTLYDTAISTNQDSSTNILKDSTAHTNDNTNKNNSLNVKTSSNAQNTSNIQSTYNNSTKTATQTVKTKLNSIVSKAGASTVITGSITNAQNKLIRGTNKIAIKINGKTITSGYAINGKINTKITIPTTYQGTYTLSVVTGKTVTYSSSQASNTIIIIGKTSTTVPIKTWNELKLLLNNEIINGKTIVLQSGTYTATSGLNIKYNIKLIGKGLVKYKYTVSSNGNGIVISSGKTVTIQNIAFISSSLKEGSVLYNTAKSTLKLINCQFNSIISTANSASINNHGTAKIENCTFKKNTNNNGVGGAIINHNVLSISSSTFLLNKNIKTGGLGGAIYNNQGSVTISNTEFGYNSARYGGAIYNNKGTITISQSSFIKNNATVLSNSYGGAIVNNGIVTIKNSNFENNYAKTYGGAIYNKNKITITSTYIVSNHAGKYGAAITNVNNGITSITYSIIRTNVKYGVYNSKGTVYANYNWWGTNNNPNTNHAYKCNVKTWIYMKVTSSKNKLGESSTIKVSFNYYSNGKTIQSTGTNYIPDIKSKIVIDSTGIKKTYTGYTTKGAYSAKYTFSSAGSYTITGYTPEKTEKITVKISNANTKYSALFIQSGSSVTSANVETWTKVGITDVFVQTSSYSTSKLRQIINLCKSTSIHVHAWVICFYHDGSFDISTTRMNNLRNFISNVCKISGVNGVCLDYVRYSGTNVNIVSVSKITNFVKSVYTLVKNINSKLLVSACVFPEKAGTSTYYGQDYAKLSPYLDIEIPMAYKYSYRASRAWIGSVVKYIKERAIYSAVVCALQTYKYDSGSGLLSATELNGDIKTVLTNGGDGYALFRYGLISSYPKSAQKLST